MKEQLKKAKAIIESYDGPPVRVMEVCGTHTHEIFHLGVRKILPQQVELISGPGCPVCVTPADFVDEAVWLALEKNVTICTFGDLVRVPGSIKSLADARSRGGKIQMVYSPMDAFEYAREHKEEQVVFLSVGFETTTPASCLSVKMAKEAGLTNYALLTANKTMPGAYEMLKNSADVFLYPGHVNAITGNALNKKLCEEEGSIPAQKLIKEWMEPCDSQWRGLGMIKNSGLRLRKEAQDFDARVKFSIPKMEGRTSPACRCGDVLQGKCLPTDCKVFGKGCTPLHPIGACMVSNEGACSAYYQYNSRGE